MDIKIKARLSAYSKFDTSKGSGGFLPDPMSATDGTVLGVNEGKYTLFPKVNKEDVDGLFVGLDEPQSVTKDAIDGLFEDKDDTKPVTKTVIDTLFGADQYEATIGTVSYSAIDSLFKK